MSIPILAAPPAVLLILDSLAAVSAFPSPLLNAEAPFVPSCITDKISLATPVGSSVIDFSNAPILPYLSPSACLPSGVITSLYNPIKLSNGLVSPLALAVVVFIVLHGIFKNIVGNTSGSKGRLYFSMKAFTSSLLTVGILRAKLSIPSNTVPTGLANSIVLLDEPCLAISPFTQPCAEASTELPTNSGNFCIISSGQAPLYIVDNTEPSISSFTLSNSGYLLLTVGKSSHFITFAPKDQIVLISTFPTPVSGNVAGVLGWLFIICCCFPSSGAVAPPIVG